MGAAPKLGLVREHEDAQVRRLRLAVSVFVGRDGRRVWADMLLRRLLALADALAIVSSVAVLALFGSSLAIMTWIGATVPVWLILAKVFGLYDRDQRMLRHLTVDEAPQLLTWSVFGSIATALLLRVLPAEAPGLALGAELAILVCVGTIVARATIRYLWRLITPRQRTIIVGDGPLAAATRRKIELFSDIHAEVVEDRGDIRLDDLPGGGGWLAGIDRVIIASQSLDEVLIREMIDLCRKSAVKLSIVPPLRGIFGTAVQLNHVSDLPVLEYNTWDASRSTLCIKRALDVVGSAVLLLVTAPLFVLIAAAVKLDSRGPVFFMQERAGRLAQGFRIFKFRTMASDAEARLADLVSFEDLHDPMFKFRRDPRVTRIGRFLRKTSLDELPQLINVLKGEMSLVGPRPEQIELVTLYRAEHLFRLSVKPGMTGPMQVYGRGRLSFDERLAVEREYIENLSVVRDLRILAMTLSAVFSGHGAY